MESYGLTLRHDLVIEHVLVRLPWTESDQGRIIYDRSTRRCYIGQVSGWAILGIYDYMVKDNHLFTDDEISGSEHAISAIRIPIELSSSAHTLFDDIINGYSSNNNFFSYDTTSNVQFVFDGMYNVMRNSEVVFDVGIMNSLLADITSSGIPYSITSTIQETLGELKNLRADEIKLTDTSVFGVIVGSAAHDINRSLIDFARYMTEYDANNIPIEVIAYPGNTTVQYIINDLHTRTSTSSFIELLDVPNEYDESQLSIIGTNGRDSGIWDTPSAGNINVKLSSIFKDDGDIHDDIVTTSNYFHPTESCITARVTNTFDFSKISFSPLQFYSTGVQQGLEVIKEMICTEPPRSLACEPMLVVNTQDELIRVQNIEQQRDDAGCNTFCDATIEDITTDCYNYIVRSNGCEAASDPTVIAQMKEDLVLEDKTCFAGCYDNVAVGANLLSLTDAFDNWPRWANAGEPTDPWEFIGGSIHSTYNFQYLCYFYSPDSYETYRFELTVRSDDADDDYLLLIAAHGTNSNICVMRTKGGGNLGPPRYPTYCVIYNYNLPGETIIGTAVNIEAGGGGWDGDRSRLFVCRSKNILTVACSPFGSETINPDTQITIDLSAYSSLSGPRPVGFGAASQPEAWFSSPSLFELGPPLPSETPIPDIYDIPEQTRWCWVTGEGNCFWEPLFVNLPCGGEVNAMIPCTDTAPSSCSGLPDEARLIYDISTSVIYEWDNSTCSWLEQACPIWDDLAPNTVYYNDITCKIFYFDCDKQWFPLN